MAIRPSVRQLGKSTAIYGIGNVLAKLAAFFLIPIYTRYLTMSDVGVLALLEMAELFLITLTPLGIVSSMWRYLPEAGESEKGKIISTAFWGIQGMGLLILGGLALKASYVSSFIGLGEKGTVYVLLVLCNVFLFVGGQFILWIFQYKQKPLHYLAISLFQFIGVLAVTIYFVVGLRRGIEGILISKIIVLSLIFLVSTIYVLRSSFVWPSFRTFVKLLKYGTPLILIAFVTPVLTLSDRYFLNIFESLDQVGIYSIAYKFGMLINMILVVPLQRGWGPMMYRIGVKGESKDIIRDILFYYALIGSLLFLGISLFATDLLGIVATEEYVEGSKYIPWITFAYLINGFRMFFVSAAAVRDKTLSLGQVGLIAIIANLFLNYLLIKYYGVMGAAWSTVVSYLSLVGLIYIVSQRVSRIEWKWNRLMKLGLITLISLAIPLALKSVFPDHQILISLLGFVLFVAGILVSKTIGSREINGIRSLLQAVRLY